MAETGAVWVKEGYLFGERDEHREPLPGAIPPGIYCINEETYAVFMERLDRRQVEQRLVALRATPPFFGVGGDMIRVATPVQVAVFEAMEAKRDGQIQ